ncbi:MAG: Na/Pi cotransporter family protein [Pseudomonadota bacterium]|nr:Na/Pi cotransporter family protein [Pseudomonadota bacterium]
MLAISASLILLHILGGVCLLLWGLRNVRNGMTRAFGADLHSFVAAGTNNRFLAFFTGIGVTGVLQSSTATALIVAAFCGQGILSVTGGIAVMLGADVGTTLVAQLLSFDLSWLAPVLVMGGYVIHSTYKRTGKWGHIGKFLVGLGIMLFALIWIKQSAAPLAEAEILIEVFQALEKDMIFAVLIAAIVTWLMHSSLAMVLLLMTLVHSGVLPIMVGMAMVLGANLGGAITPLVTTMADKKEAGRVPLANLFFRFAGVIIALPFLHQITALLLEYGSVNTRLLVDFHMVFNIVIAAIGLPLAKPMGALVSRLLVTEDDGEDPSKPRYLDHKELDSPSVALSAVMRESLRMADELQRMLEETVMALRENNLVLVGKIRKRDNTIDRLNSAVKHYMAKMTRESLDPEEAQDYMIILGYASNIESAGDTIDKSIMDMAEKKIRDKLKFSEKGWAEIQKIHDFVLASMKKSQSVFMSGDYLLARELLESKEKLRVMEQETTRAHLERIREGVPETIATSSLHLDIIRDYRRIHSYMAAVAYPILEEAGQLRSSRLRKLKKPTTGEVKVKPKKEQES